MSRISVLNLLNVPAESQAFVEKSQASNGFLPNLIGVLAHAPAALETYMKVGAINASTSLTLTEREVVQLAAAQGHGCDFCLAGHGAVMMKKAGAPRSVVQALQTGAESGDARLDAVAAFTRSVIATRGAVSDADYQAFLAHGYGPRQALEIVLGVSLATLCNFANNLGETEVNAELRPYLPHRA
ncbi:carboxymuconolactone decarboxylase family protein [Massilia niastensis]|uniref:carboxymuconolactone decarboxylase family protein n=1 Tax=Massilia niastensis TaxID=544911 RepID=UPI000477831A|nr:carboxymuconolactone decarboxylase family protein [Massilia niastensis]